MASFAEEREIEGLKRKWKIAEVVDFEEIKRADSIIFHQMGVKEIQPEEVSSSLKLRNEKLPAGAVRQRLTLTSVFKVKEKSYQQEGERRFFKELSQKPRFSISGLFIKRK